MGSVERPLGMLASLRGHNRLAAEHFDAALGEHRQIGARLLVAGTLRDAGRSLNDAALVEETTSHYSALGLDGATDGSAAGHDATGEVPAANMFRRDGEVWLVGLNGSSSRMRDTKGMRDLAQLLGQPGRDVHVLDLVASGPTLRSDAPGEPLDDAARRQYRDRLLEIEIDLAEADDHADVAWSEQLHTERDALIAELSGAYGLGGRARRRGDSTERARSAVTQRIREAMIRIEAVDPDLAGHLRRSLRTGTFCSYAPEHPTIWML
jgi:hypothetical protein